VLLRPVQQLSASSHARLANLAAESLVLMTVPLALAWASAAPKKHQGVQLGSAPAPEPQIVEHFVEPLLPWPVGRIQMTPVQSEGPGLVR
jgi:hypothetical protein